MYFRKKFLGKIFSIFLIFIFSAEVTLPKNKSIKLIKDYLGDIKTLQAEFSQTNQTGDIVTGVFFFKKARENSFFL